jgi:hypothetical protein
MKVALRSRQILGPSGSSGAFSATGFGLVEFLSSVPAYANQLYALYKWCKIHAVQVRATLVNTTSSPIQFVLGVIPHNEQLGLTLDELAEVPGSTLRVLSAQGGLDRVVITNQYDVQKTVGNLIAEKYWVSQTQAASAVPLEQTEPIIMIGAQPMISVNWSSQVVLDFVYHVEFFDLNATT